MSERRRRSHTEINGYLALGIMGLFCVAVTGISIAEIDEGRGGVIANCPTHYPGIIREIQVDDMGSLTALVKAAKKHGVKDSYAHEGFSDDIADLKGELACAIDAADYNGAARAILLPAGLEALSNIDEVPTGLHEITADTIVPHA